MASLADAVAAKAPSAPDAESAALRELLIAAAQKVDEMAGAFNRIASALESMAKVQEKLLEVSQFAAKFNPRT